MSHRSKHLSSLLLPAEKDSIVEFIRNGIESAGLRTAVVGLSGGIDSAVVAHLCVEAVGSENVHAIMMPHRISNPDSLTDAQKVIAQLECQSRIVDISPMTDPYIERYVGDDTKRKGNIFARARMIVLYDISAEVQGLVIGTGNKTEILLGYSTLHGDTACALAPLGDLYKTQVRELARYLGVNQDVLLKAPSADLWAGQTDEGELGITYDEADRLLNELVDRNITPEELIQRGEDSDKIHKLTKRMEQFKYKRVPALVYRLSTRTE